MSEQLQRALAAMGLVLLAPVLLAVALAVLLFSGRPVLYAGERVGKNGETFTQVKFRTMIQGADNRLSSELGKPQAERVTRVGSFLRKSSLDELPQLLNVVRGEMALVGPRPLLPLIAERIPSDHQRFAVLPGITGLAQISGRNMLAWSKRLEMDAEYVEKRAFSTDLKILWLTLARVAKASDIAPDRNTDQVLDI